MKRNFAVIVLMLSCAAARADDRDAEALFVRRVVPLLRDQCLPCHGGDPDDIKGSLDLRSERGALVGGESGEPAIVRRSPETSPLFLAIMRQDELWSAMPPKEAERLSDEQIAWISDWIAAGAPWPDSARRAEIAKAHAEKWSAEDGVVVKTSGGLSPEWTNRKYEPQALWAYQPVKKPEIAAESGPPIDALIAAQMPEGLQPAPRANRVTLVRRATFDLTGLPPGPEEVKAFVNDPLPDRKAFAKVIDRLLESPHYGERMAQHWLDVVRYADSSGFSNDFDRGNAWRYRDYVVRAFHTDKPYDRFIREQIAGDEIDSNSPEMLVATGFLRMGPWELTGMEVAKVARQRFLDDVTNSVGETFLAHSLRCARCHDHKFDPIPTRDYYAVQAVFATTQLAERSAPFLPYENTHGFEERKYLQARRKEYLATLRQLDEVLLKNAQRWFEQRQVAPDAWHAAVEKTRKQHDEAKQPGSRGVFETARSLLRKQGVPEDEFPPKLYGFTPAQYGNERVARKGLQRLRWELDRYQPFALSVYSGRTPEVTAVYAPTRVPENRMTSGEREETCILIGGDPFAPGERVEPGVLSVLARVQETPVPQTIEGRRRAFAEWVAAPDNPLTSRTIVNRIWLWHFNEPLAGNPNNFGSTGKRPTHPELLDWLATTFVEDGWSFKAMHRHIMNSEAYCRSARHPDRAAIAEKDPLGTSYAVFKSRRLTAEELRDAMLAATGELNPALGGIPCRPEINLEAALQPRQVMGTFAAAWTPNPLPEQRHRRSLYSLRLRGLTDPMLEVFNAPTPDFSCERRGASTVTPQVFSLFNSRNSHARALALANRVVEETATDEQALVRCFELTYSRPPSDDELQICLRHWRDIEGMLPDGEPASREPPLEIRREAIEENTGETFSFQEKLYSNADFVPDLQPSDVDRHVRALADVCLALLNTNEFVYVD